MLVNLALLSLMALILIGTPAAALVMALRSKGKGGRAAGWVSFLLAFPMPAALLIDLTALASRELAWRSVVKMPCALCFLFGFWFTALLLGRGAWQGMKNRRLRIPGRAAAVVVTIFLCTFVAWWVAFVSAVWASEDREVVVRGERMVEEASWMDRDYYAYYGPVLRGRRRVYGSWELSREDFGEARK